MSGTPESGPSPQSSDYWHRQPGHSDPEQIPTVSGEILPPQSIPTGHGTPDNNTNIWLYGFTVGFNESGQQVLIPISPPANHPSDAPYQPPGPNPGQPFIKTPEPAHHPKSRPQEQPVRPPKPKKPTKKKSVPRHIANWTFGVGATAAVTFSAVSLAIDDIPQPIRGWVSANSLPERKPTNKPVLVCDAKTEAAACSTDKAIGYRGAGLYAPDTKRSNEDLDFIDMAYIAAEDPNFLHHHGVSPRALARAARNNSIHFLTRYLSGNPPTLSSFLQEGGSTVDRQMVSNSLVSQRGGSVTEQLQEMRYALRVNEVMSKPEIIHQLEDSAYYGRGAYGTVAAKKALYGLEPDQPMTELQSIIMVALVNRPDLLSMAITDLDTGEGYKRAAASMRDLGGRVQYITDSMRDHSMITERLHTQIIDEFKAYYISTHPDGSLKEFTLPFVKYKPGAMGNIDRGDDMGAHHAYDTILWEALENLDPELAKQARANKTSPMDILTDHYPGLKIISTIDPKDQKALYDAIQDDKIVMQSDELQVGAAAVNRQGEVRALIGSKDYYKNGNNYAVNNQRGQGSLAKLYTYAYALENGMTPDTKVTVHRQDTLTDKSGRTIATIPENTGCLPKNGPDQKVVTIEYAFAKSCNTPIYDVVKKLEAEGKDPLHGIAKIMEASGIEVKTPEEPGFLHGVIPTTPLQRAAGYAVVLNGGKSVNTHFIKQLVDGQGNVIWDYKDQEPKSERVYSQETAERLAELLKAYTRYGGGAGKLHPPNGLASIGGKSGTEDNRSDFGTTIVAADQKRGALAMSVWVGDPDTNSRIADIRASAYLLGIDGRFISKAMDTREPTDLADFVGSK